MGVDKYTIHDEALMRKTTVKVARDKADPVQPHVGDKVYVSPAALL
jgi:hypothetical protein